VTPQDEVRFLSHVLKRVDSPPNSAHLWRRVLLLSWPALVALSYALFHFGPGGTWLLLLVATSVALATTLVTFTFIKYHAARQWPMLAPHIKRESLAQRIDDLKHNTSLERTRGE
jgi:hypothetical protein